MEIRVEPSKLEVTKLHPKIVSILQGGGWLEHFSKFHGRNLEITRAFTHSFDGENATVGNLIIYFFKHTMAQITCFLNLGKYGLKINIRKRRHGPHFLINQNQNPIGLEVFTRHG